MFEFVRTHQRLMQLILLVLIVPSFALIGVGGYSTYVSGDHDLVKVGDSAITLQQFDEARRNQLQQMQQDNPGGFDPAALDTKEARSALLDTLIDRTVLVAAAAKDRFSVSDAILRQTIASMPELQVEGKFSAQRYDELLKSNGLTTKGFEQSRRADLALSRVLGPVAATASVPEPVVNSIEQVLSAQRTIRVLGFPSSDYSKGIDIAASDIQAWYDKNKKELELPEQVSARYLLLNEAAAMQNLPAISHDAMLKYYEQNKARYVVPGRVNLSHILVTVAAGATDAQRKIALAKADQIAKKVSANVDQFAEIARTESQDAGTARNGGKLGWITHGSWPAPIEKAVFALKKGEVSGVVEGPEGYHIFKADDIQPQTGETFEQAKSKVESEIRRQMGADRFADMATKLTSLVYDNSSSLEPASQALGIKVKTANGIARDHLLAANEVGADAASASADATVLNDARVRRALFAPQALTEKQNSGVIEISPDTMIVVRVNNVVPAHIPPLDKVTDLIRQRLVAERALTAAADAGKQALAAFQKESSFKAPDKFGAANTISRANPQGVSGLVLDAIFKASVKTLPTYVGIRAAQGYVVVRIEQAQPGKTNDPSLATLPAELNQAWGQAEQEAVLKTLRTQAKVKMLREASKALAGEAAS